MRRGDVLMVELPRPKGMAGHEQYGTRPAIVLQDDDATKTLSTVVVLPVTSQRAAMGFMGTVPLVPSGSNGLITPSFVLVHQIRAIDKNRIERVIGHLTANEVAQIEHEVKSLLSI